MTPMKVKAGQVKANYLLWPFGPYCFFLWQVDSELLKANIYIPDLRNLEND